MDLEGLWGIDLLGFVTPEGSDFEEGPVFEVVSGLLLACPLSPSTG